jgi:hypothetical protein
MYVHQLSLWLDIVASSKGFVHGKVIIILRILVTLQSTPERVQLTQLCQLPEGLRNLSRYLQLLNSQHFSGLPDSSLNGFEVHQWHMLLRTQ